MLQCADDMMNSRWTKYESPQTNWVSALPVGDASCHISDLTRKNMKAEKSEMILAN